MSDANDKRYMLIGYKSDSVDHCKGQVMDRYASDFFCARELTESEAFEKIADYRSIKLGMGEVGWSFYLFPDALEEDADVNRILHAASVEGKRRIREREEREAQMKVERERAEAFKKTERERQEYERLKAKFEAEATK